MATEYGVDPWTVVNEWSYARFDFNRTILGRYNTWFEREQKKHRRNSGK